MHGKISSVTNYKKKETRLWLSPVALEMPCEVVTNMVIEGEGCALSTANMEVVFCTGEVASPCTHLMGPSSLVPTLVHSSLAVALQ